MAEKFDVAVGEADVDSAAGFEGTAIVFGFAMAGVGDFGVVIGVAAGAGGVSPRRGSYGADLQYQGHPAN